MQKTIIFSKIGLPLLAMCFQLFSFQLNAQEIIDVGVIPGEIGTYYGNFDWRNSSSDTVEITLSSDTDQLIPETERIRVNPNQRVSIPFQINTENLIGQFQSEFVISRKELILNQYLIRTRVLAPVIDVFKEYRNVFFPFRSKSQLLNFKSGFVGDTLSAEIVLYNFSGNEIDLSEATSALNYDLVFFPSLVKHNGFTMMRAQLSTDSSFALGFTRTIVELKDESDSLIFAMPVQFTLEERPSNVEDNSPSLAINITEYDFKSIQENSIDSTQIVITNVGTGVLEIKKMESNCSCLTYKTTKNSLIAGESVQIDVYFNTKGRSGYETKTLAFFTNDPNRPTSIVTFKANVR
ncbi:MAG: hypothetical protein ACI9Z3_001901 [Roseivirga sp.]|jgi:hypothetical protein